MARQRPSPAGRGREPGSDHGHRSVPHTADLRIEAWAGTRERCVAEAVEAMVESFADVAGARERETVSARVEPDDDEDLLVSVLDEVVYLLDTRDLVLLGAELSPATGGGFDVRFRVTGIDQVSFVGAVPKAVSLHELVFEGGDDSGWSCQVTLDV